MSSFTSETLCVEENLEAIENNNGVDDEDEDIDLDLEKDGLSPETLQALKEFTLSLGVPCDEGDLSSVRNYFNVQDTSEIFEMNFVSEDGTRSIQYTCKGVKRELGQTLSSTGLTIWRACEHMCEFVFNHPELIANKTVCELGSGLGLLAILMDKMQVAAEIVATDGDDDTMELLYENVESNQSQVEAQKLWWGLVEGFKEDRPDGFDVLVAADVIYEPEQVVPLLETVIELMKVDGEFLLAFARRNVSIDVVLETAETLGLYWTVLDSGRSDCDTEPIYSFKFGTTVVDIRGQEEE